MFPETSIIYPAWALILLVLSLILISRDIYRYLLPNVFLGTLTHFVLLYITINIVQAWKYTHMGPFNILGIPFFILVSWGPSLAIFLWGLPEKLPTWTHYIYIFLFAIAGTFIDSIFHNLGLRPYCPWFEAWMWFFPLFLLYWLNYFLYIKRKDLEK